MRDERWLNQRIKIRSHAEFTLTLLEHFHLLISVTLEETIRQKQRFRKSVTEFISIATALTDQELELALARIADQMSAKSDEQARIHWRFRGQLLKSYYDMRLAGKKRLSILKRLEGKLDKWMEWTPRTWGANEEYFLFWLLEHRIEFPATENDLAQWSDNAFAER